MWIATKTITRTAKESRLQLEESLRRLQTDHIDEWRLHNIWSLEELDKVAGPGGSLEAAIRARDEGLVRYISISGHTNPRVQVEALNRFPFDSVLCAVSVLDHFILSFAEEFLPVANARGVAIIGMKVMGLGVLAPFYEKALRYTLGLPISTAIVGMETMEQLEKNLSVAENFKPLTDEERLELFREIMPQLTPQKVMWKAEDWENPTSWKKR
jgi:predicted aldo/keto reductase-like oxidoreductase